MRYFFLHILLLLAININAQVQPDRKHHNFGVITKSSQRYTDFTITNKTAKKVFILRCESDRDVLTMISDKTIMPDSSSTIRVQLNPREKGRFSREIQVFISSEMQPLVLTISGDVSELPGESDLACPDFNQVTRVAGPPEFVVEIDVFDNITGLPVKGANLKIVYLGLVRFQYTTPTDGHIEKKIPIGYYYFVTRAEGYKPNEFDRYVNSRNNKVVIYLDPVINKGIDPAPDDSLLFVSQLPPHPDPGKIQQDTTSVVVLKVEKQESVKPVVTERKDSVPLITAKNRANNIVFLIDISGSMLYEGKLELLKTSMIELAKELRPEDRVSLVVFSNSTRIVMENVSGANKEEIISKIQGLEAGGYTAGSEGMKESYRIAQKNFIAGGNNVVIMATDGAFNVYTTDVTYYVKKYQKKGISTSVLGIKNSDTDATTMRSVAQLGTGTYIPITNFEEARSSLLEEIARISRID